MNETGKIRRGRPPKGSGEGKGFRLEIRVDDALRRLLTHHFDCNADLRKRLFENPGAALMNFSAKIDVCRALRLVGKKTYDNLHVIRKIRNGFAHGILAEDKASNISPLTF